MNKLTKIVATIGPSSESAEVIEQMIARGVNVFRFNFKHNTVDWHQELAERVESVAKRMKIRVGKLLDLQGPEIRIKLPQEEMTLKVGEMILLDEEALGSKEKGFSITHPEIIGHLNDGQSVMADDGAFEFEVLVASEKRYLKSKSAGLLGQRKTLNIPGADFPFPVLIERDFEGLDLAKKYGFDYVALSFVRSKEDVLFLREQLDKLGLKTQIVSKIETQKALDDLEGIVEASDGLMVARGDLGVELPFEQVPYFQKKMIRRCIEKGKFVITATQMLQTMIESPIPTRAEVSDVANAAYDLSDAVMLSGESASGKYPIEAVDAMSRTIEYNETKFSNDSRIQFRYEWSGRAGLVSAAAYDMYLKMYSAGQKVAGFVVFTYTGSTARIISSLRPNVPIYAFCPNENIAEGLCVNYGVYPVVRGNRYKKNMKVLQSHVLTGMRYLQERKFAKLGDNFVVMHGDKWEIEGGTSTVKLVTLR